MNRGRIIGSLARLLTALALTGCGSDIETRLQTRASIEGRVILAAEAGLNDLSRVSIDIGQGEGGIAPTQDGTFRFADLEADLYTLVVTYSGGLREGAEGSAYRRYEKTVTATEGSMTNIGDLLLELGRGTVEGTLSPPDGVRLRDIVVALSGPVSFQTVPAADGTYAFSDVPVGAYRLSAVAAGLMPELCQAEEVLVSWDTQTVRGFTLNLFDLRLSSSDVTVDGAAWYALQGSFSVQVSPESLKEARYWVDEAGPYETLVGGRIAVSGLAEGESSQTFQFRDQCGFESEIIVQEVHVDSGEPLILPITVGDGSGYVRTPDGVTTMQVRCVDDASPMAGVKYRVGDGAWQEETYREAYTIDLGDQEGSITVTVVCTDLMGHESEATSTEVLWDHTPPVVEAFTLNDGDQAEATNEATVRVRATLSDNMSETGSIGIAFSETDFDCSRAHYQYPEGAMTYTLSPGDGLRSLYLCAQDVAGNTTQAAVGSVNAVRLDTVPPSAPTVVLEDGTGWTPDYEVSLEVTTTDDDTSGYVLRLWGDLDGGNVEYAWDAIPEALVLSPGEGAKAVYAQVRDRAGNVSDVFSAAITLNVLVDESEPQVLLVVVGEGTGYVHDPDAQVRVMCRDDHAREGELALTMEVRDEEGVAYQVYDGGYEEYVTVTLSMEEGPLTLTATCIDPARNAATSEPLDFVFDNTPPTVTATLNRGGHDESTRDRNVTVHIVAADELSGVLGVAVSETAFSCATAAYVHPAVGDVSVMLSEGEGRRAVYLCAKDWAGNVTAAAVASLNSLFLDTIAPAAPGIVLADGSRWTRSASVALAVTTTDDNTTGYTLRLWGDLAGAVHDPFAWTSLPTSVLLAPGEGEKAVMAQVEDGAGNLSAVVTATITVDSTPPSAQILRVGTGTGPVNTTATTVDLLCQDRAPSSDLLLRIEVDGQRVYPTAAEHGIYSSFVDIAVPAPEGSKSLTVLCVDPAGNTGTSPAAPFAFDMTPPTVSGTLNGGSDDEPTNDSDVTVHIVATDQGNLSGVSGIALSGVDFDCLTGSYEPLRAVGDMIYPLSAQQGRRYVWICAIDGAGNTTATAVQTANSVWLDTQAPGPGVLTLAHGAELVNTDEVAIDITLPGGEASLLVMLGGHLEPTLATEPFWVPTDQDGPGGYASLPSRVILSGGDGLKMVTALWIDGAGNESSTFLDVVDLDSTPPQMGTIMVNGQSWQIGDAPVAVETAMVVVEIFPADTDAVFFEISETPADLLACQSGFDGCAAITPSRSHTLTSSLGVKTLSYRFFDLALNGSDLPYGTFQVELTAPQTVRPVPVLEQIWPGSVTALESDTYVLTAIGTSMATDTKLRIGDFELGAICAGIDDRDLPVACTDATPDGRSCDGQANCHICCQVVLSAGDPETGILPSVGWPLMKIAGSHIVRLVTAEPVLGTGVSAETDYLHVVAPIPRITDFTVLEGHPSEVPAACLGGHMEDCGPALPYHHKRYIMESPSPQDFVVLLWGSKLVDNLLARIAEFSGQVNGVQDLAGGEQVALITFTGVDLPPSDVPYTLSLENPPPGGGQRDMLFGLNFEGRLAPSLDRSHIRKTDIISRPVDRWIEHYANPFDNGTTPPYLETSEQFFLAVSGPDPTLLLRDDRGRLLYGLVGGQMGLGTPLGTDMWTYELQGSPGPYSWTKEASLAGKERLMPDGLHDDENSITFATGVLPKALAVGDMNADGYLDVAVANSSSDAITLHLTNGQALNFSSPQWLAAGDRPSELILSDLNGDGDLDLVVANMSASDMTLGVYTNQGDGVFSAMRSYPLEAVPTEVVAADLNGDGLPDLAVACDNSNNTLAVLIGASDGSFAPAIYHPLGFQAQWIQAGELNGDGVQDLILGSTLNFDVQILIGLGDGAFSPGQTISSPQTVGALADLDGDGVLDLITGNNPYGSAGYVSVHLGNGDGTFQEPSTHDSFPDSWSPESIVAADLNADGAIDVAVTAPAGSETSVLLGNGDGSFQPRIIYPYVLGSSVRPDDITLADMNNDGTLEILTVSDSQDSFTVMVGTGWDPFVTPLPYPLNDSSADPWDVEAGDFNQDGVPDLVVATPTNTNPPSPASVRVLPGIGDGTFGEMVPFNVGIRPHDVAIGDFNGDGLSDLAVTNRGNSNDPNDPNDLTILLGNGDGTFQDSPGITVSAGEEPISIAIGDFNEDGAADLAVANLGQEWDTSADSVDIFLGNGNGTFQPRGPITLADGLIKVVAHDLNGDGHTDLAVAQPTARSIAVLLGHGDGSFAVANPHPLSYMANDIAIEDMDGDGRVDILAIPMASNDLSLYPGNGDGTFGAGRTIPTGTRNRNIAVADFDGDGRLDVALTDDSLTNQVSLLLGDGTGHLELKARYPADLSPMALEAADLNRDGALDLAVANYNSDSITFLVPPVPPGPVRQVLDALPPATVGLPLGRSTMSVHQATQDLDRAAVRYFIEFAAAGLEPSGTVTTSLTAPDGTNVPLTTHGVFEPWPPEAPTSWRLIHHAVVTGSLEAVQPRGDWTLTVDNLTNQVGELRSFRMNTRGRVFGPQSGDRADAASPIVLPSGSLGRVVHGTTLSHLDKETLSCLPATAGAPDRYHEFTLRAANTVSLWATASFDAALELRRGSCSSSSPIVLRCNDNGFAGGRNPALFNLPLNAGVYCLIVDGHQEGDMVQSGDYSLTLRLDEAVP